MDTKYWGPSGWRLLHLITFTYDPKNKAVESLFRSLPFVLPCKFCRSSLHEYMEDEPLEPALKSKEALSRWLNKIHCMVNAKLIFNKANIKIVEIVKCEFVENIYQLPSGKLDYNLWAYHSSGNLAAGLAYWKNK